MEIASQYATLEKRGEGIFFIRTKTSISYINNDDLTVIIKFGSGDDVRELKGQDAVNELNKITKPTKVFIFEGVFNNLDNKQFIESIKLSL